MKLLAIDPGLCYTGYAVYVQENKKIILLKADLIHPKATLSIPAKLKFLYDECNELICDNEITDLALETPFLGKNAATFAKLGYIRSILYLLSEVHTLSLHEFPPQVVKKAVTGNGNADKDSVARVMRRLYPQLIDSRRTDVTDAAAVGACAIYLMR